jgi:hypothetical protein
MRPPPARELVKQGVVATDLGELALVARAAPGEEERPDPDPRRELPGGDVQITPDVLRSVLLSDMSPLINCPVR